MSARAQPTHHAPFLGVRVLLTNPVVALDKRTFCGVEATSALTPKADMCSATRYVHLVPKANIANLIDHLVGAGEQLRWHSEAKRLGGLQVDHQLELGRLLDG